MRFSAPEYLPLLALPALLLVLWAWQFWRRQRDLARMRRHRRTPVREKIPRLGELPFWLCLILALAATIVALARPVAVVSLMRTAGIDLVILQDGSASMRVRDVSGNRWRRSMAFLRTVGESLQWEDDRIALALFANIATPQVRLTRDPNTFFFFLDHLEDEPPFRLQDDTTWDTNIERGIYWGLKLIEKDEELEPQHPHLRRRRRNDGRRHHSRPHTRSDARDFVGVSGSCVARIDCDGGWRKIFRVGSRRRPRHRERDYRQHTAACEYGRGERDDSGAVLARAAGCGSARRTGRVVPERSGGAGPTARRRGRSTRSVDYVREVIRNLRRRG